MIPTIISKGSTMIRQISNAELRDINKKSIKKWHLEKTDDGYIPVSDE